MSQELKPYPVYTDPGIPWLGPIPEHWSLQRTKTVLNERSEKGFPDEPMLAATQTKGVVRKELYETRTVVALKDFHLLKLVREGDFVISLRSFQGGIEYAREQGIISPAYTILFPKNHQNHAYLAWLFKSKPYIENLTLYVTGIRQGQNIDYVKLGRSAVPLPPFLEQTAIVRFINHADQRIKRFIRAKQKLIKLLIEQKQAIIQQAVTRGLDPNVRLKPSGVEWLGDVPERWDITSLRMRYSVELGKMLDAKRITGNHLIPYLRNRDVQWDHILVRDLPLMDITPAEFPRYTVQVGDLLVCEGGQVGRCAFWKGEITVCGYQKALHRIRATNPSRDFPRFFFYQMQLVARLGIFAADGNENTFAHLTCEKLRRHRFLFPPAIEQKTIADWLDQELQSYQNVIIRAKSEIALIQEYRTCLIADVVTGKLDVRAAAAALPDPIFEDEPLTKLDIDEDLNDNDDLSEISMEAPDE